MITLLEQTEIIAGNSNSINEQLAAQKEIKLANYNKIYDGGFMIL